MKASTHCKICKKPMSVTIDDGFPEEGIGRWLPMATCNPCFDLYKERQTIRDRVKVICEWLSRTRMVNQAKATEKEPEVRDKLNRLTKDYVKVVARFYRDPTAPWSEEITEEMLYQPEKWDGILDFVSKRIRDQKKRTPQS